MKTTIRRLAAISIALITMFGTTFGQDVEPPTTPTGLAVIEIHNTAIGINWNLSTDNSGVAGYQIYVNDLLHGASNDNEYIITNLSVNTSYAIEVVAVDIYSNMSDRSSSVIQATTTSSITGTLVDGEGLPLIGLNVSIVPGTIGSITDTDGSYIFPYLAPGIYTVTAAGVSYNVEVSDNHITVQDFALPGIGPEVHTSVVTNITGTNAQCGGTVSDDDIIVKGVIWSTSPNITLPLSEDTTDNGSDPGIFTTDLRDLLSPNTVYYIRAYARNSIGTSLGEEYRFYTGCNPIILNEQITHNSNCGGTNGVLSISHLELDVPYTYSWTGPNGFIANSSDIIDLATGIYEITVTDKNGCPTVKSYVVTEPDSPAINNLTETICDDGSFTITPADVADGIVPAGTTYSWDLPVVTGGLTGGAAAAGQTSISGTLSNPTNTSQTATYTVTPVSGTCTGATFTVTVTVNPTPAIINLTETICDDGSFTITPVDVADGIVPAGTTYSWDLPVVTGGLTGGAAAAGQTSISGTLSNPTNTSQTATYTVTPVSGTCTGATFTVTVTVDPTPAINNLTETICDDGSFTITPADVADGIVPAGTTYSWDLPVVTGGLTGDAAAAGQTSISGTLSNPTNTSQTATYTVTPVSGTCTGATFTVTVTVNPTPAIINLTETICDVSSFTIIPANGADGIVPAGTTYSWDLPVVTGGLTGGAAAVGQISISGTLSNPTNTSQTATYTVTPVSGTCTGATFTVTVTVNPTPAIIVNNLTHISCYDCNDGAIDITVTGGVPSYSFSWTGPEGFSSDLEDITNLSPGFYRVQVEDSFACSSELEVEIGNPLEVTKTYDYDPGDDILINGIGTLRYAMEYANDTPGLDSISFNIPGDGPFTISPTSILPPISESLIIDGYSQSGASTANGTTPATIMVELNGSELGGDFRHGLIIIEDGSTIRGLVINGFAHSGILIEGSDGNVIEGNYIGTNFNGTDAIPNAENGILISGAANNLVGGTDHASRNIISGNTNYGITIINAQEGEVASGNSIKGNFIGLAANGENVLKNENRGVYVRSPGNFIGGSEQGAGNVISGNSLAGIQINGRAAVGNTILGNIIGLDATGNNVIVGELSGSNTRGIELFECMNTTVGGASNEERNTISGNFFGIHIYASNEGSSMISNHKIIGNYIGTNTTGKDSVGNLGQGIRIENEKGIFIGSSLPGERNIISGNRQYGIQITTSSNNEIIGNFIGTDVTGTKGIPNRNAGLSLVASDYNQIGGPDIGEGNLISANQSHGISLGGNVSVGSSDGNVIQGNYIGTDISGTKPLGTVQLNPSVYYGNGIAIGVLGNNTLIGGYNAGEGNLIAYNDNCGIVIFEGTTSQGNRILSNSIHSNGNVGIDLCEVRGDGVTLNDETDGDTGPNGLQNFPELDNVTFSQDEITVTGTFNSVLESNYLFQFFVSPKVDDSGYGEGETLIGSESVATVDGEMAFLFSFPTSLRDGLVVTATATDEAGNTSEFSNAVGGAQDQVVSGANMPMRFWIHEEGVPYITDDSDFEALQQSFDTWEAISTSQVGFVNEGPTDQATAVANDGINLITFMDESYFTTNEVLGVAAKTLYMDDASGTAEIVDADIIFNPYNTQGLGRFSTDTHTGDYDLQSIATHEIGHTFGMIHTGVLESTMFYAVMENTTDKRTLEQDDIAWASFRYPKYPEFGLSHGFISGNITYGDDPQFPPVGGALVIATNTLSGASIHAYSDENGDYKIPVPAGNYTVAIEPLDGNVHGYNLTKANISYYIDGITNYTDFPNEYYNAGSEGAVDDNPDEFVAVNVIVADTTGFIDLVTNKDVTPPEIVAVTPKRDSVGASVMTQVFLGFSEQVDITTFADTTCYLTYDDGDSEVYGNFVVADNYGRRIAFTPREYPLDYSSLYELQITEDITDLKGNPLVVPEDPYVFTTEDPDLDAPEVTDMIPDYGNDTVFVNANVMVFFSEPMDVSSTPDGFSVRDASNVLVEGFYVWDEDLKILTFDPGSFLDEGMAYTVTVNSGMRDLSQNPLVKDTTLVFSTVPEARPEIIFVGPGPGQDSVSLDSPLLLDFSEPINPLTTDANTVQILLGGTPLAGSFEFVYDNSRVVFRPTEFLAPNTWYNVLVDDQIFDMSDPSLHLEQGLSHQFVTAETVLEPNIVYLTPSSGVAGIMVTIGGEGFDPNPDMNQVYFGDFQADIIANGTDYITTTVPADAVEGMVHVEVDGKISNEEYFYVVPINEYPGDEIRRTVGTQAQAEDVEIEPDAAYAYVTNSGANSITRLNMVTFQVQSLAVGQMPVQIEIHPNGDMAYVTNHLSHTVSVIDLDAMKVVQTIAVGINPYGVVVSPNGDMLYVANTTSEDVLYIDVDPNSGGYDRVVRGVKTNASNTGIDISPDAGLVLIACEQGILFLITDQDDPAFNTINRTVNTSAGASGVRILPDAGVAVAATGDNYLVVIGIIPGVNYGHIVGKVNTRGSIGDIDISPDGQIIYVTHPLTDEVSVYQIEYTGAPNADASVNVSVNLELINVIEVDEAPFAIAIDPRGDRVFVGHYTEDGQVTEIDVSGTIDKIQFLEELIQSVIDAIQDEVIYSRYGDKLLVDLEKTLSRVNTDQLESAIDHLDNFIIRVTKWTQRGGIPEELGNAWLEAAYRIREQLVEDLLAQADMLKGAGVDNQIIGNKDLAGEQALKLLNQPNPFSDQTRIIYEIPEIDRAAIPVTMRVYNTSGQVMKTLVQSDMVPGSYSVEWNGNLDDGGRVPDGIYLLELTIPGQREVMTISVIR